MTEIKETPDILGPIKVRRLIRINPSTMEGYSEEEESNYEDELLRKIEQEHRGKDKLNFSEWREISIMTTFFWKDVSYIEESWLDQVEEFKWKKYGNDRKTIIVKNDGNSITVIGDFKDFSNQYDEWFKRLKESTTHMPTIPGVKGIVLGR